MSNENLRRAKATKNDEFYTLRADIEAELSHYKDYLKGKIIYCNCDTPESNFVKFLNEVKDEWGIKDVWHTSLDEGISFDSPFAKELLAKCDVVITNPPFSLTRPRFVPMLDESGKKFLFIGNLNMATMKEIFPLIRDNKLWTGYTHPKEFIQPDGTYKKFGNCLWWTNLPVDKSLKLDCNKHFDPELYPLYDNYAAWNVDKVADIPCDDVIETLIPDDRIEEMQRVYGDDLTDLGDGKYRIKNPIWGVPVTFIERYTPPPATGGGFGSESSDSEKEQMAKTSELTDDTIICDTLLDHRADLLTTTPPTLLPQITHKVVDALNVPFIEGGSIFKRLMVKLLCIY